MSLSRYFDLSISRRDRIARRLAPCWRPASHAVLCQARIDGRARAFPALVYVNWLGWQLRLEVKTINQ